MRLLTLICFALGLTANLTAGANKHMEDPKIEAQSSTSQAIVRLSPTEGNSTYGTVVFFTVPEGVKIIADIYDLKPGKHGFHIHEHGDCSARDASSAGGHFNPLKHKHGSQDDKDRHAGDLGNLDADEHGHAHYERTDPVITLKGPNSIVGRSLVVHADPDDFVTQPTGNSGGRVACGVIQADNRATSLRR